MKHEYISFFSNTNKQKPNTLHNQQQSCPFCDVETLTSENRVIHRDDTKILIENKYPVLEGTNPLVYIEQPTCGSDITTYSKEVLLDVIRYGVTKWLDMLNSGKYQNVLFFKNHGVQSAGSILHPHMQIIGLYDKNPQPLLDFNHLSGPIIHEEEYFQWCLNEYPFSEQYEFTIRLKDAKKLPLLAQAIQYTTHYIVNVLNTKHQSFNLCFYSVGSEIIVKIFDLRPASALFLGYSLSQVPNNLHEVATDIRNRYKI